MRRILILLILVLVAFFALRFLANEDSNVENSQKIVEVKKTLLRFAVVTDSENDRENLAKALNQAKGEGVSFVVGLGDFTKLGEIADLEAAKKIFDEAGLNYYVTSGDRDLWASRNAGEGATANFKQVFGSNSHVIDKEGMQIVILDNSDIYKGISHEDWSLLEKVTKETKEPDEPKVTFVMAHKTPYHPQSSHIMGADNEEVASQAGQLIKLIEQSKVDGFFSGDLHFFAQFKSPGDVVKITTIGAVGKDRNFLGPRFGIVTVYDDYSWEVEDVEIQ